MILSDLALAVDKGLTVLTHRLLSLLALVMTFGLFCWAMWMGSPIHFMIAASFGGLIFLPILFNDFRKREVPRGEV
jgi:hypothetical protein